MTSILISVGGLETRLREAAEDASDFDPALDEADLTLLRLGFLDESGALTESGHEYYVAQHVWQDPDLAAEALGALLKRTAVATTFCGTLWPAGEAPVAGAVSLLKRLTGSTNEHAAKRWLELMNRGRLIAYNRKSPRLRVLFNPEELVPPEEETRRERDKGHVISPDTGYGNLLALRELLRAASGYLYWYEQHMEAKVLEVLYRELPQGSVAEVRLLSGPANITAETRAEFKKFRTEMKTKRGINCAWRTLPRKSAQLRHDRFFFSEGLARNLPPLNLILRGSTGEILPSSVKAEEFHEWWSEGEELG